MVCPICHREPTERELSLGPCGVMMCLRCVWHWVRHGTLPETVN